MIKSQNVEWCPFVRPPCIVQWQAYLAQHGVSSQQELLDRHVVRVHEVCRLVEKILDLVGHRKQYPA